MARYEVTERGFKHYEPIGTAYGHIIRVYESSSADEPKLWLGIDATGAMTGNPTALLTVEQARELQDTLSAAIAQHYQREVV